MKKHRIPINTFRSIVLFFTLVPMLIHTDYVTEGARYGLLLWYQSVVPALFPFMVISGMIVSGGGISILMAPVHGLLGKILPISKEGCYVLISGLLCGYPMGAKTCADFVDEHRISLKEGMFLMAICNHPSPMFLLGYVYPFFKETISVWKLLTSVYGPVVFLAFTAKMLYYKACPMMNDTVYTEDHDIYETSPHKNIDETIIQAIMILCKIGGYLVLFSILIVFLRHMEDIPETIRLFLIGFLEMTTSIRELSASLEMETAMIASVTVLTFGGCSGIFQTKAVLGNKKTAGLSIRPYIFWKLSHAVLSAGIAFLVCKI